MLCEHGVLLYCRTFHRWTKCAAACSHLARLSSGLMHRVSVSLRRFSDFFKWMRIFYAKHWPLLESSVVILLLIVLNCSLNYHYYRCCCWCAIWLSLAVLCWLLLVYVVIICRRCGYWCRLHRSTTCRTHRVFQFVSQAASVRTRHSRSPRKYSTVRSYLLWHAIDNMLKLGIALRQKAIMLCSLKIQNLWQCCNMISFNGFGYVFKKFPHI